MPSRGRHGRARAAQQSGWPTEKQRGEWGEKCAEGAFNGHDSEHAVRRPAGKRGKRGAKRSKSTAATQGPTTPATSEWRGANMPPTERCDSVSRLPTTCPPSCDIHDGDHAQHQRQQRKQEHTQQQGPARYVCCPKPPAPPPPPTATLLAKAAPRPPTPALGQTQPPPQPSAWLMSAAQEHASPPAQQPTPPPKLQDLIPVRIALHEHHVGANGGGSATRSYTVHASGRPFEVTMTLLARGNFIGANSIWRHECKAIGATHIVKVLPCYSAARKAYVEALHARAVAQGLLSSSGNPVALTGAEDAVQEALNALSLEAECLAAGEAAPFLRPVSVFLREFSQAGTSPLEEAPTDPDLEAVMVLPDAADGDAAQYVAAKAEALCRFSAKVMGAALALLRAKLLGEVVVEVMAAMLLLVRRVHDHDRVLLDHKDYNMVRERTTGRWWLIDAAAMHHCPLGQGLSGAHTHTPEYAGAEQLSANPWGGPCSDVHAVGMSARRLQMYCRDAAAGCPELLAAMDEDAGFALVRRVEEACCRPDYWQRMDLREAFGIMGLAW